MKLGELIAIGRECKGWTLRDLERETGVSNALISQIENGHVKDPGFSTVVRLTDALGVSLERAAKTVRPISPRDVLRATTVVGKVTGKPREGDQCPGMPGAICHACGLGYKCADPDCPNDKPNPMFDIGLSQAEMKAQGARCGCRGSDDYCVCQNVPDRVTLDGRAGGSEA